MVQQLCLKIHDLQGDAAKATAIPRKWITGRNVKEYERLPQHILNASIKNQTPIALSVEHGESLRINFLIHPWIFYFRLNNFSSILQTTEMSSKTKLFCRWQLANDNTATTISAPTCAATATHSAQWSTISSGNSTARFATIVPSGQYSTTVPGNMA